MRIYHVTTAHRADDVRIYERECRSLAAVPGYQVALAAPGQIPGGTPIRQRVIPDPPSGRAERFLLSPLRAARALHGVDADVFHFHDPELLPVALLLAKRGRKVIWDAHEDYLAEVDATGPKDWIPTGARGFVQAGTRRVLHAVDTHAAGIVAATVDIAAGYRNPRTVVVGNQARVADFAACRPTFASRQLLYTGHVGDQHCFRELVEGVAAVPDTTLVVAGRSRDEAVWAQAQAVLGPRLRPAGWVDRAGLRELISASALGVVSYADIRTNDHNSPNKLFEFAAAGLPVVATPNAGNAKAVATSGGGVVADDFTAAGFKEAIAAALADESRWTDMSAAARHWADEFGSWERAQQSLLDLYAAIARDGSRPGSARDA